MMICEPNLNLPQKIDLATLREADNTKNYKAVEDAFEWSEGIKHKISYIQKEYNVLPKFYDQFEHLNTVLSTKDNNYLNCRWNQFLDYVPVEYIRVRLYVDYQKEKVVSVVRRKMLNGKFYGVDSKLAPIPQLSDPRQMFIGKNTSNLRKSEVMRGGL